MTVAAAGLTKSSGETSEAFMLGRLALVPDLSGALWLPEERTLVVADLHLEKGSAYAARGVLLPPYDSAATLRLLGAAILRYQPARVIALGDSFHDGEGAERMHADFRMRLEALMAGRDWFWVAGNHDPQAPAGLPGETVRELAVGSLLFRHEPSRTWAEGEVAGHLHPCARIVQRGRSVRRRCFAGDGVRMVMPAFGAYTGSLNVLDRAYDGLFRRETLVAYMLGSERIFALPGSMLRPG